MSLKNIPAYKMIVIAIVFIIFIGNFFMFYLCDFDLEDKFKISISSMMLFGFALTFYQLRANNEWERRKLGVMESIRVSSDVREIMKDVDKIIGYSSKDIDEAYEVAEIHKFFCKVDDKGDLIFDKDNANKCRVDDSKRHIRSAITEMLGYYDYLADGILNKVLDEKSVKDGSQGQMRRAYRVFEKYIKHLRDYYKRPLIFKALEVVIDKWDQEEKKSQETLKPRSDSH